MSRREETRSQALRPYWRPAVRPPRAHGAQAWEAPTDVSSPLHTRFDAVECDEICLRGEPVGLALSLGDRLQFFTTLEALSDLDGRRFRDRASLLAQVRDRMAGQTVRDGSAPPRAPAGHSPTGPWMDGPRGRGAA